jgi:hypothetical protein
MNKRISLLLLICITGISLGAPVDLMIGARGFAMGGAYSAISDDASSGYWNPAGLSQIVNPTIMESNWIFQNISGLNVNYVSCALPIQYVGTVSAGWLMQRADLEYGSTDDAGILQTKENSAYENTFSFSVGRQLWDKFAIFELTSLGLSFNRTTFRTADGNGAGIGFDIALKTRLPYGFSFSVVGRNIGADMMGEKIDPSLRFGLGYQVLIKKLQRITIDIDGEYLMNRDYKESSSLDPAQNNIKAFGGFEYALLLNGWEIALRGGSNRLIYTSFKSTYEINAGLGIKYLGYSINYAFDGNTDKSVGLGYSHRIDFQIDLKHLKTEKNE